MEHYIEYQKLKLIELKIVSLLFMRQYTNVDLMPYFIEAADPLTLKMLIENQSIRTYDRETVALCRINFSDSELNLRVLKGAGSEFCDYRQKPFKYYNLDEMTERVSRDKVEYSNLHNSMLEHNAISSHDVPYEDYEFHKMHTECPANRYSHSKLHTIYKIEYDVRYEENDSGLNEIRCEDCLYLCYSARDDNLDVFRGGDYYRYVKEQNDHERIRYLKCALNHRRYDKKIADRNARYFKNEAVNKN